MNRKILLILTTLLAVPAAASEGEANPELSAQTAAMAEMMAKVEKFTKPGPSHEILKRFIGTWDTDTRITMGGMPDSGEMGRSVVSWLMEGRYIQFKGSGQLMGQPIESFVVMGYDNFKKSFVAASMSTMDTAMIYSEGDMDPGGKALLMYGTLDEYLTGEHDKMVKAIYRFISDDEIVMELHDLPIGENNTKVIEMRFTRVKE